ncbi:PGF-CTERM sorting domain-containing protein [Halomicrococcus sp. NG-SE-24]|uniref:DUF7827 domain-containing protein n=1 Tax=Halomicrococcus sp. NG-SE-24 TaxID=3436928 RepID=UPI003D96177E
MNVRNILVALVLTSLVVGSAVAQPPNAVNADAKPEAVSPASMQPAPNGSATLGTSIVDVQNGEKATINLSLDGTSEAHVLIGGGTAKYRVNTSVVDENGDGQISLVFDTSKASDPSSAMSAKGDDSVRVLSSTSTDSFEPRMYGIDVRLYNGSAWLSQVKGGLNVQGETTTTTTTTDSSSDDGTTTTSDTTTHSGTTTDSGGQPGFGAGVAAVALAAVALLARRS